MDAQLTTSEINTFRDTLKDYDPALEALATLEEQGGKIEGSFDRLWVEKNGPLPQMPEGKSLWQITLKQLRQEVCGDDSFRTKLQEYTKNPGSTPLLTGLIVSLVGVAAAHGLPLDPAIATIIVLYILKIGLNIFCEYTESSPKLPPDAPESRRLPDD
ncbi:MAG TPA: hypothetical protein V6D48_19265 [Oculatellaceae cyanobacterium]